MKHITPADIRLFQQLAVPVDRARMRALAEWNIGAQKILDVSRHFLVGTNDGQFWGDPTRSGRFTRTPLLGDAHWFASAANAVAFGTGRVAFDDWAVLYVVDGLLVRPYLLRKSTTGKK